MANKNAIHAVLSTGSALNLLRSTPRQHLDLVGINANTGEAKYALQDSTGHVPSKAIITLRDDGTWTLEAEVQVTLKQVKP